LGRHDKD